VQRAGEPVAERLPDEPSRHRTWQAMTVYTFFVHHMCHRSAASCCSLCPAAPLPSALTTSAPPQPPSQVADRLLECGTTASVVLVQGDTCALANAGDTTAVLGR
jgi:hypothetical protein